MKIDLIANDGSPLGVTPPLIHGRGVGGAELAMMSLMEVFAMRGHEVTVYNDPEGGPNDFGGVAYRTRAEFVTEHPRDVLIIFRSPNQLVHFSRVPSNQRVIWWSCDQQTTGNFSILASHVDFCVTISPFHTAYHRQVYNIPPNKIGHIDIGVRTWEYKEEVTRNPHQLLFCSVPDRGLSVLFQMWPKIKQQVPEATLVITSDYRLWAPASNANPPANNQQFRLQWVGQEGVSFLGAVPRAELVRLQKQSAMQLYPCIYPELFCIATAECQAAGAFPLTSESGALATTNQFGRTVPGNPASAEWRDVVTTLAVDLLTTQQSELLHHQEACQDGASRRFDFARVAEDWEYLFERGKLK